MSRGKGDADSITFCQIKAKKKRGGPEMSRAVWGSRLEKMELRKSHRCECATTERQTHTFEHLAAKKTPSTAFGLWDSRHQQGKRGCRASARLTRGDIRVARPHVERSRACLRQDRAALADTHHTGCVNSFMSQPKSDDRHTKAKRPQRAYLDRRISVNWSMYRPCSPMLTSG